MLTQTAIVQSVGADHLEVVALEAGCHGCGSACGVAKLSVLFGKRLFGGGGKPEGSASQPNTIRISNPGGYQIHDHVELALDEALFLRAVAAQYLLPLVAMLGSVALARGLYAMLWTDIVAAALGLYCGVCLSSRLLSARQGRFARGMSIRNLSRLTAHSPQPTQVLPR